MVEDKHSTPAEVATTRIDFGAWLESLPERTRHVAETLATGEATSHVARMFGFSASRISQLRRELYQAWRVFQGEVVPATSFSFGLIHGNARAETSLQANCVVGIDSQYACRFF